MPTRPLESILYREMSKVEAKKTIETASLLLQELVNFGTNALARCSSSNSLSGKVDEDIAILALYRHLIELTDGIEVLLSQSCAMAAVPVLRSSFEASLATDHILASEADYVQRSLAWIVGYTHKRIDMYERLDPSSDKGKEAKRLFDDDEVMVSMGLPIVPVADIQKAINNLQSMLAKPHLQPIDAEYKRYKKPEWYRLFGGPNDLRALAQQLRRGGQYEVLYRQWSTTAHAQDFFPFMDRTDKGEPAIRRLRDHSRIGEIAGFAASFLLRATRFTLKKLRPGEDLSSWYKRDVQQLYRAISGNDEW